MRGRLGRTALLLFIVPVASGPAAAATPEGQLTWAVQFALAPTWFDQAETTGILTPFFVLRLKGR